MVYIQSWQSFESPHVFPQVISPLPVVQKLLYNQKYMSMSIAFYKK